MKREHLLRSFFLPAATLWQRELVRFWRQKSRVLGVVASPLVFWLLIGYGSNDLGRFYSGALVLTVMFSAIFSTISIIEDRREGFLLSMLVSPAPSTILVRGAGDTNMESRKPSRLSSMMEMVEKMAENITVSTRVPE